MQTIEDLHGIIEEYTVSEPQGIFGWKIRHQVIANIISSRKFPSEEAFYEFLDRLIDNINPIYKMEARSIVGLCDHSGGVSRIPDQRRQNILYRKMISKAPAERVPRHRLISNLLQQHQFEPAEAEIKLFKRDYGRADAPVWRYSVRLKVYIARFTEGLQDVDRAAITLEAAAEAEKGVRIFADDKNLFKEYFEAAVHYYRYSKNREVYDRAMAAAYEAMERILDPDLRRTISRYEQVGEAMVAAA